jgi:hypothetical protein
LACVRECLPSPTLLRHPPQLTCNRGQGQASAVVAAAAAAVIAKSSAVESLSQWRALRPPHCRPAPPRPGLAANDAVDKYDPNSESLPTASVIIAFVNEEFYTLMRTIWAVLQESPVHLLHEVSGHRANRQRDWGGSGKRECERVCAHTAAKRARRLLTALCNCSSLSTAAPTPSQQQRILTLCHRPPLLLVGAPLVFLYPSHQPPPSVGPTPLCLRPTVTMNGHFTTLRCLSSTTGRTWSGCTLRWRSTCVSRCRTR